MRLLLIALMIILSIFLGQFLLATPKNISIFYDTWEVVLPVWVVLLVLTLFMIFIISILQVISLSYNSKKAIAAYFKNRNHKRKQRCLHTAILRYFEGQYYKVIELGAQSNDPLVLFCSATSQIEVSAFDEALAQLSKILKYDETAILAVKVCQIRILLKTGDLQTADQLLVGILKQVPLYPELRALYAEVNSALCRYKVILDLYCKLPSKTLLTKEITLFENAFNLWGKNTANYDELNQFWSQLRSEYRKKLEFFKPYFIHKISKSSETIKRDLKYLEGLIAQFPKDSRFYTCLGDVCSLSRLWGKAISYYEYSLMLTESAETHLALAEVLALTGDFEKSNRHYQQGLKIAVATSNC